MMSFKTQPKIASMDCCRKFTVHFTYVGIPTTTHSNIYGLLYQKFAVHTYTTYLT